MHVAHCWYDRVWQNMSSSPEYIERVEYNTVDLPMVPLVLKLELG